MRHRVNTRKLNRSSSHRKALLANLVSSLVLDDRIETTLTKAKAAARLADRMVTLAKKNTLASRRRAVSILRRREAVKKLFEEIGPRFTERQGGYTRVLKMASFRRGDGARTALLLFSEEAPGVAPEKAKAKAKPKVKAQPEAEPELKEEAVAETAPAPKVRRVRKKKAKPSEEPEKGGAEE